MAFLESEKQLEWCDLLLRFQTAANIPAVSQRIRRPVWAKFGDPSHPPATAKTILDNDFFVIFNCLQAETQICMLLNLNIATENVEIFRGDTSHFTRTASH